MQSASAWQASGSLAAPASVRGMRCSGLRTAAAASGLGPRVAVAASALVSRVSGGPPALTDDQFLHAETCIKTARFMENARAVCERVDKVILMQRVEHLGVVIAQ